ncbi:MAG: gamma-glutamyltransferase [Alphaproteobacteria bacterium]|nr:gamma-glutamyltransferase [Alphaproteobacteria bacterium]
MFVHRPIVMTKRGLVVAGHHKAAEAGAAVLREGGNAMDAAVAAAATLTVAIPHMNSVGGDCFALWFDARRSYVSAINGSGGAPAKATIEHYRSLGHAAIPERGPLSISVPGVPHAWQTCLQRYGSMPLARLLEPAIALAEDGLPLDRHQRDTFNGELYARLVKDCPSLGALFGAPGGRKLGDIIKQPALAASLKQIAEGGMAAFYDGPVGQAMTRDLQAQCAILDADDLKRHTSLFQTPLTVPYAGALAFASPPNTQGVALAVLLGLLERDAGADPYPARFMRHKLAAFAIRDSHLGDPSVAKLPHDLLKPYSLDDIAEHGPDIVDPPHSAPAGGDTTTVVVIDAEGNAVSWVQSVFEGFGSGVASESTGIVLQNRLSLASLKPGGPNSLAPGRRPFHTLCPCIVAQDGAVRFVLSTPGDHGQPQTLAQVLHNAMVEGMDLQEAVEAPRIRHDEGKTVMHESRIPAEALAPLRASGYTLEDVGPWSRLMGGVNAIQCLPNGLRLGAGDPRRACYAVAE